MKIKTMTNEEFWPLFEKAKKKIFKTQIFSSGDFLSAHEKVQLELRKKFQKERIKLYFGLFDEKDRFVGWTCGFQANPNEFYMMSSAVFPEYRRKGWYTKLVKCMLAEVDSQGFQMVSSNHIATNNPVIIAKMKLGFMITGIEVSDNMGIILRLVYSLNPLRAEVLKYRTGEIYPSKRVKKAIKLK